jgi:transcriptional regulator with XRE-family HTH domain
MLSNLRTIRLARRLTQADLARRARVDQVYISALERGLTPRDPAHVNRIARALDVEPHALTSAAVTLSADGTVHVA